MEKSFIYNEFEYEGIRNGSIQKKTRLNDIPRVFSVEALIIVLVTG